MAQQDQRDILYEEVISPILFKVTENDPEKAHHIVHGLLAFVSSYPILLSFIERLYASPQDPVTIAGITFPNRLGLAAGFDKNCDMLPALAALGFGFIEGGTVTNIPQQSAFPSPRITRIVAQQALINRMGFNNDGANVIALRLANTKISVPLGLSIGKSKTAPDVISDYVASLQALHAFASYIAVNVSSPNTPGLRDLQEGSAIHDLLSALQLKNRELSVRQEKPIFVKISPDLTFEQIDAILQIAITLGLTGIIATNTSIKRDMLQSQYDEPGGLSGRPLFLRSLAIVAHIRRIAGNSLTIIGSGGISCVEDARRMLDVGADLIQVYTAFIYKGPAFPSNLMRGLHNSRQ